MEACVDLYRGPRTFSRQSTGGRRTKACSEYIVKTLTGRTNPGGGVKRHHRHGVEVKSKIQDKEVIPLTSSASSSRAQLEDGRMLAD
jgi:hypothetical protein